MHYNILVFYNGNVEAIRENFFPIWVSDSDSGDSEKMLEEIDYEMVM